ncbi:hypothetical protein MKW92_001807 [Papaver armeniacum]|nr:hypothetical protein MKW92_001807 [Papaver armeniacum]
MGTDLISGGKSKKTKRTAPKSDDICLKLDLFGSLKATYCTTLKMGYLIEEKQFPGQTNYH